MFVKPATGGSSIGAGKAKNEDEAKEKMYSGEYFNEREDKDWEGDTGEEIYNVEVK